MNFPGVLSSSEKGIPHCGTKKSRYPFKETGIFSILTYPISTILPEVNSKKPEQAAARQAAAR